MVKRRNSLNCYIKRFFNKTLYLKTIWIIIQCYYQMSKYKEMTEWVDKAAAVPVISQDVSITKIESRQMFIETVIKCKACRNSNTMGANMFHPGVMSGENGLSSCIILVNISLSSYFGVHLVFNSPELKAQVRFSDHLSSVICHSVCPSVCNLFTFSSSSPEPLGQFQPNLAQSILG